MCLWCGQATPFVNNSVSKFTKAMSLLSLFPVESCAFASFPSLTSAAPSGSVMVQQAAARQTLAKSKQDTWMVANQHKDCKPSTKHEITKMSLDTVYIHNYILWAILYLIRRNISEAMLGSVYDFIEV